MSPPGVHHYPPELNGAKSTDKGGWSILQNLDGLNGGGEFPVYVHPLVKRTKPALSLEMYTESLGSETGSDDPISELPSLPGPERIRAREVGSLSLSRRSGGGGGELPPPLPLIQVERVREGGRMVMRAVAVGPTHACFVAERGNGRLRLRLSERCVLRCGGSDDMEGVLDAENGDSKYSRATKISRCNEDDGRNREMLNLEAFWVATSLNSYSY